MKNFKTSINLSILNNLLFFLIVFFMNACTLPVGGECKYTVIKSHATVKEIKKDFIIVNYDTKLLPYINTDYQEQLVYKLPPVHQGEILPANIEYITEGSCSPIKLNIDTKEYFTLKNQVISYSSDGEGTIEKGANKKINIVAKNFLILKKMYPNAKLILYAHASVGTDEYRFSLALIWYAKRIKTELLKKGLTNNSVLAIAYNDEIILDFIKPLPNDRVTFGVDLGLK